VKLWLCLVCLSLELVCSSIVIRDRSSPSPDCNRGWIFCIESVELVMCDSVYLMKGCSYWAKKREKLYVAKFKVLTIDLREVLSMCTFGSLYSFEVYKCYYFYFYFIRDIAFFYLYLSAACDHANWVFVKSRMCFFWEKNLHFFV